LAPDPTLFITDLQDAYFFWFFDFEGTYTVPVHVHHSSKKTVIKKSQNSRNQGFSSFFCLLMEGSGFGSVQIYKESGCGSKRPQKNVDPTDPEHWWEPSTQQISALS
jgi:hypothetical protein